MTTYEWSGRIGICLLVVAALGGAAAAQEADGVTIEQKDDRYTVKIDGELFTEYIFKGYDKPILYPVIGPHGISMTRNWPMAEAAEGESKDHPHQKSLWFAHGDVNGIDFWAEGEGKGKIQESFVGQGSETGLIADHRWRQSGQTICTERRMMWFRKVGGANVIDLTISLGHPGGSKDVVFGDTKEGTMAIRTRPELEINRGAKAVNSEGVTGKAIWGKRAKWVDYSGVVDDKTVGIAIFDHPSNPRHPTWWHARDYGLIAANPFGIHDFEGKGKGAGDLRIPAGQSIVFRYRFVFHEGDAEQAKIAQMYEKYAAADEAVERKPASE